MKENLRHSRPSEKGMEVTSVKRKRWRPLKSGWSRRKTTVLCELSSSLLPGETLSEVLTRLGQEMQASQEDSEAEEAAGLLPSGPESATAEHLQQQLPPLDTAITASPHQGPARTLRVALPPVLNSGCERTQSMPEGRMDARSGRAGNREEVQSETCGASSSLPPDPGGQKR